SRLFRTAVDTFATALGRTATGKRARRKFDSPVYDRILFLHMAALAEADGGPIQSRDIAPLAHTLQHERRFWDREIADLFADPSLRTTVGHAIPTVVAAVTLLGGIVDAESASAMVARVTRLADVRADLPDLVVGLLHRLYSREPDLHVAPLEPDLLGE